MTNTHRKSSDWVPALQPFVDISHMCA